MLGNVLTAASSAWWSETLEALEEDFEGRWEEDGGPGNEGGDGNEALEGRRGR